MNPNSRLDWGLLGLRLGFAFVLFGYHGLGRLMQIYSWLVHGQSWGFVGVVAKLGFPVPVVFALASALSESVGVILVALGLGTQWASLLIAISMGVAVYSKVSKGESFELPALYLLSAMVLAIAGGGRFSLERRRSAPRKKARAAA
jgi:putative oxidoreductase